MNENNRNDIYKNYNIDTVVQLSNSEVNRWADYSANINLQHDLKQKGKFSFNFDYIHYLNDQEVNYGKKHYDSSGTFIYPLNTRTNKYTLIDFWVGSIDYTRSLSDKVTIEGGLKQTVSLLTNDISLENSVANTWMIDTSYSAIYKLREMYPAVYTSLNMTLSKMTTLKMGLRYEYTYSNLGTEETKDIVDRKYGNLFPSVFLSHKLTKNTTFNLSYSKRITRPTFSNLAPFTYFASPTTIVTGNPTIQPSINNTLKVDYVFKQFLFSLAVGKETNAITGFQPESDSVHNRIVYTPQNLESKKNITGIFSIPVVVNRWWIMQFNVTALWQQINANYKNQYFRQDQSSVNINATQRFTLPKKYSAELVGFFQSAYLDGIIYRPGYWSLDMGVRKNLPGKSGSLSLNMTNVFNSIWSKREWDWPDQNLVGYFNIMPSRRTLKLTYSKNFGKDKLKEKRARVTGADDAKSRVD